MTIPRIIKHDTPGIGICMIILTINTISHVNSHSYTRRDSCYSSILNDTNTRIGPGVSGSLPTPFIFFPSKPSMRKGHDSEKKEFRIMTFIVAPNVTDFLFDYSLYENFKKPKWGPQKG